MKAYCCGFLFTHDYREVLLIEKRRPAWQAGKLNGVGGHVEQHANETPYAAMVREFKEEVGVEVLNWMHFRTERFGHNDGALNPESSGKRVNVYFFAATATPFQWEACRTQTDEHIVKLRLVPAGTVDWTRCIYNLEYLIPMARVLLRQPIQNIPLP